MREPIREPVREPIRELSRDYFRDPVKEPVKEPVRDPVREPIKEPIREPIRELIREPLRDHLREPHRDHSNDPFSRDPPARDLLARGPSPIKVNDYIRNERLQENLNYDFSLADVAPKNLDPIFLSLDDTNEFEKRI